jgi:anti-sigma-K factor RskA
MMHADHDRWRDDVAAYMLGALEPEEAAELERHAETCEQCRSEIRWLTPAVEALPEAVERLKPPPELRDRILAEVGADARAAGGTSEDRGGHRLRGWLRGLGSGPMGLRPVVGVAAAVLVAVAGYAIGGGIGGGSGGEESTNTIVTGHAPGITAKVVRKGDGGTLELANVHKLPSDRVLEAWVRREGEVEPVRALFAPDREGRASTTIADMDGVDLVMVTREPAGGSPAPTSSPIVEIPIPQ